VDDNEGREGDQQRGRVMANEFFEQPVLNSPYAYPQRHWELDDQGQPTQQIAESRRRAEFITPIPKPPCAIPGSGVEYAPAKGHNMFFEQAGGQARPPERLVKRKRRPRRKKEQKGGFLFVIYTTSR